MKKPEFDCHFCGGKVLAQQTDVMRQWKGRYILIENVPAYVCTQCGEQYYDGIVAEAMDQIMQASETKLGAKREICIPVVDMPSTYPSPHQAGVVVHDDTND